MQSWRAPRVRALLAGQHPDGGFGVHPYRKWTGAHWRLVSLVELGAPPDDPRLAATAATWLNWLTGDRTAARSRWSTGLRAAARHKRATPCAAGWGWPRISA